ncbi:hypothetical protein GCM10023257_68660 [Streptomyces hyderabadensis]|uniref:Uncharacterized protein n=1 Tax=Streptomyces hyderabadensis TaxID=598549 RepID=A0ABP9IVL5_9ACTN
MSDRSRLPIRTPVALNSGSAMAVAPSCASVPAAGSLPAPCREHQYAPSLSGGDRSTRANAPPTVPPPGRTRHPRGAFEAPKAVFMQVRSVWKVFMIQGVGRTVRRRRAA